MRYQTIPCLRMACAAALLATLSACGGGGDSPDLPCGGSQLRVEIAYEVNGRLVDASRPIILPQGAAVVAVPRFVGLPSACSDATRLTVSRVMTSGVPTGVTLDPATGIVSGTSVARGNISFQLTLSIDGYVNPIFQSVDFFM